MSAKMKPEVLRKLNQRTGKRPAVFLDRDGVLCVEKGYVTQMEDLEIFPYTRHCIDLLHQKGFLAVCVTNQAAIARGLMTEDALSEMNDYLIRRTGVDAVYYCPHHPEMPGRYGITCSCRKPNTGMVESAIGTYGIDRDTSYIVGDRTSDILCGQRAGLKTVLLKSGYRITELELSLEPDYVCRDLEEFCLNLTCSF